MGNKVNQKVIFNFKLESYKSITKIETELIVNYIFKNKKDIAHEIEYAVNDYTDTEDIPGVCENGEIIDYEKTYNDILEEIYNNNFVYDDIIEIVEQFSPRCAEPLDVLEKLVELSLE